MTRTSLPWNNSGPASRNRESQSNAVQEPRAQLQKGTGQILEIASFLLAPGVSEQQFEAALGESERFLAMQPGFLFRRLSRGADHRWSDMVLWRDQTSATLGAEAFEQHACAAAMLPCLDLASLSMRHETLIWSQAQPDPD